LGLCGSSICLDRKRESEREKKREKEIEKERKREREKEKEKERERKMEIMEILQKIKNKKSEPEIKNKSITEKNKILLLKIKMFYIFKIYKSLKNNLFYSEKEEEEKYSEGNKVLNDTIDTKATVKINANFNFWEDDKNVNFDFKLINSLHGKLKLLFLKYISTITNNEKIKKINNEKIIKILQILNKDLELINKEGIIKNEEYLQKDVQAILKEKEGNNIIEYAKYINSIITIDEIKDLIKIH